MPSGNRIDFTVGVKADKSSFNQVAKALRELQQKPSKTPAKDITDGLKDAALAAGNLRQIMEKAWNPHLEQFNLTKVNTEIKKTFTNVQGLNNELNKGGEAGQKAFNAFASSVLNTNIQVKESNKLLNEMADTFGKTVKYGIASSVFNTIKSTLQQSFYYAKDLDLSLTDIRIVTGDSADQMERFAKTANEAAQSLGRSTLDYTRAALTFYQQGLNDVDVQARAENVLKAQNVTGAGSEMADYLTSVWNGFNVSAEETTLYVDKLAAVADSSASNMSQLAIAMSKVASSANAMGVDVNQLSAQISTIIATTRQAPESVGTALKTIYARINDIKTGSDEAEVSLGKYSGVMQSLGFNVLDSNNQLRDTGQVMEEIGGRWSTLSREQQVYLAQTMAGTRQYNKLVALFDNWTKYSEMLNVSLNAQGTLNQKNATYLESVKAHMQQLNTETERTYQILSDTKAVNDITDALRVALESFNDLIEGMGGGRTVLINFASQFVNLFSNQIGKAINTQIKNFQTFIANLNAEKLKKNVLNIVQTDALATGRDTALQKQADIAERIFKLRKTLTEQQQKELVEQQKSIGMQQRKVQLLEEEFKKRRDAVGFDETNDLSDYEQSRKQAQETFKALQNQRQILKDISVGYNSLTGEQKQRLHLEQSVSQLMDEEGRFGQVLTQTDRDKLANIQAARVKRKDQAYTDKQIGLILQIQNQALSRQQDQVDKITEAEQTRLQYEQERTRLSAMQERTDAALNQAENQQKLALAVRGVSAAVQAGTAIVGGLKTAWDQSATAADRANGYFAATSGGLAALFNAFAPGSGFLVQGVLNFGKEIFELTGIWDNFVDSLETAQEKLQKLKNLQSQSFSDTQNYHDSVKQIQSFAEEWNNLQKKSSNLTEEEQERYNTLAEKLVQYNKNIKISYDEQHNAIITKNDAIQDTIELLQREYEQRQKILYADSNPNDIDAGYRQAISERNTHLADRESFLREGNNNISINDFKISPNYKALTESQKYISQQYYDQIEAAMLSTIPEGSSLEDYANYARQKIQIINNIFETIPKTNSFLENQYEAIRQNLLEDTEKILQIYDDNLSLLEQQIEIDNKTLQDGVPIPSDIVLAQIASNENAIGHMEYQRLKMSFGEEWFNYGKDLIDTAIVNYVDGLGNFDIQNGITEGQQVYPEVAQMLRDLLSVTDISNLINFQKQLENFEKDQETKNLSASKYKQIIINKIQSFIAQNSSIKKYLQSEDPEKISLITSLLEAILGINNLTFIDGKVTSLLTDSQKYIKERATDFITAAATGVKDGVKLEFAPLLLSYLESLKPEDLANTFSAMNSIDFSELDGSMAQLVALLKEVQDEANLAEVALSWDDQLKIKNSLAKDKSITVDSGVQFLKELEKQNPELLKLATQEGGRYGQAYVEQYTRIIRENEEKKLEEAKQKQKELQLSLQNVRMEEDERTKTEAQLADVIDQVIQHESNLARITESTNEDLKTQLELLRQRHDAEKDVQSNAISAYGKLRSGQELSEGQLSSLRELEYANSELKALSEDRSSSQYLNYLKQAISKNQELAQTIKQSLITQIEAKEVEKQAEIQAAETAEERAQLEQELKDLTLQRMALEEEKVDGLTDKYKNLSDMLTAFESFEKELLSDEPISPENAAELNVLLEELINKYPQVQSAADIVAQTWLAGTDAYKAALGEVKEALNTLSIQQTYNEFSDIYDRINIDLNVEMLDDQYQQWKQDVEDFFKTDRQLSVSVDNLVEQELNELKTSMDQIYDAAGKIGQNFIVAAGDIEQVLTVFPEIAQGMQLLDDGSYQLSQNMVQYALGTAQTDVEANGQAVIEKLQQEAAYHDAKADIYHEIAEAAHQLASGQVSDDKTAAQLRGKISAGLGQLQITNKEKLAQFLNKANDKEITDEEQAAQDKANVNAEAGQAQIQNAESVANAELDILDQQTNQAIDQTIEMVNAMENIKAGQVATWTNGRSVITPAVAAQVAPVLLENRQRTHSSAPLIEETVTLEDELANFLPEDFANLQNQALIREEQEREAAQAARRRISAVLASLQRFGHGLGNVMRGQGINGAKPEKEDSERSPSSRSPSSGSDSEKLSQSERVAFLQMEVDIYHDINIILGKISNLLKEIQKEQAKLIGQDLAENYREQLNLLNYQISAQKEKIRLAQFEQQQLRDQLGAEGISFTPQGDIVDYNGYILGREQELNSYISYYNTLSKQQQEELKDELDSMKRAFENVQKWAKRYEEITYNTIPDLESAITDELNKQIALKIKHFKISIQAKLDIVSLEKQYKEFVNKVVKPLRPERILPNARRTRQVAYDWMRPGAAFGGRRAIMGLTNQINETVKQIQSINRTGTSSVYGNDKASALADLKQYREQLQEYLTELQDSIQQTKEYLLTTIDTINESFEKRQKYYQDISNLLNHDKKLVELIFGKQAYARMNNLYSTQHEYNKQNLKDLNTQANYWDKLLQKEIQHQKTLRRESNEWWESQEKIDKFSQNWQNSVSQLYETLQSAIDNLSEQFQNNLDQIFDKLEARLTKGDSLDYISEEWELINKQADLYLDNINSMYEIEKLRSRYNTALKDNKDNAKVQKELNALMDNQIGGLRERDKLTQYDVDRANALLDIELKRIQLQNAQQNKTKLRLRRDSQGNYSYQFTADDGDVQDKVQDLRDAEFDLYNMTKREYNNNTEEILQSYSDWQQKIKEIALAMQTRQMTEEEGNKQIALINDKYTNIINGLVQHGNNVRTDLAKEAYASLTSMQRDYNNTQQNQLNASLSFIDDSYRAIFDKDGKLSSYYQSDFANVQDWASQVEQQVTDTLARISEGPYAQNATDFYNMVWGEENGMVDTWRTGIQGMAEQIIGAGGFQQIVEDLMGRISELMNNYNQDLTDLGTLSGTVFANLGQSIDPNITKTDNLKAANDRLIASYQQVYKSLDRIIENLNKMIQSFEGVRDAALEAVDAAHDLEHRENWQASRTPTTTGTYLWTPFTSEEPGTPLTPYDELMYDLFNRYGLITLASGGYTGNWNSSQGKVAILHQKELVLNEDDTRNILKGVSIAKDLDNLMSQKTLLNNIAESLFNSQLQNLAALMTEMDSFTSLPSEASLFTDGSSSDLNVEQPVYITANFPAVTSRYQIEMAFEDLKNQASQYIYNNKKY